MCLFDRIGKLSLQQQQQQQLQQHQGSIPKVFFTLLGFAHFKAARKTLLKLASAEAIEDLIVLKIY